MAKREVEQASIRGDGKIVPICIEADNLAEATHKAILGCYEKGIRVETPKQRAGMTLGYDADMLISVRNPDSEPKICSPGIQDDARGLMQYILEVTHGIHNHWKKNAEHPEWWGYTYNERFVDQLPFVFQRIEKEWKEKGRISGRDYNFSIWRAGEDIILEQPDAPCFQRGQFRFVDNSEGEIVMSYQTDWRSRDLLKAWNENNLGQVELMKLVAARVSKMTGQPIKLGSYTDRSSSLHLYGMYFDRDGLADKIKQMKQDGWEARSMTLGDYIGDPTQMKRLIAAQMDAESKGYGLNQPAEQLAERGYNLDTFEYPADWDSWPKSWDAKPDVTKLARVI